MFGVDNENRLCASFVPFVIFVVNLFRICCFQTNEINHKEHKGHKGRTKVKGVITFALPPPRLFIPVNERIGIET